MALSRAEKLESRLVDGLEVDKRAVFQSACDRARAMGAEGNGALDLYNYSLMDSIGRK